MQSFDKLLIYETQGGPLTEYYYCWLVFPLLSKGRIASHRVKSCMFHLSGLPDSISL